jgi:hypothetical protein
MEISGKLRKNVHDKWEIVDDDGRACVMSCARTVPACAVAAARAPTAQDGWCPT